ncbi:MAG: hypothetical protein ACK55I_27375, partial [bacterium]
MGSRTRTNSISFHNPRYLAANGQLPIYPRHRRNHGFPCNHRASGLNGTSRLFRPPSGDLQPLCSDVSSKHRTHRDGKSYDGPRRYSCAFVVQSGLQ